MPTIEITEEQAQALARGENLTISPPAPPEPPPTPKTFLLTRANKSAWLVKTTKDVPTGERITTRVMFREQEGDEITLLATSKQGPANTVVGTGVKQATFPSQFPSNGRTYSSFEVSRAVAPIERSRG